MAARGEPAHAPALLDGALAEVVEAAPPALRAVVAAALAPPAKRLRPRVFLLSHEAVGGRRIASALPGAVAVEIAHCASLLVDDVVDAAPLRRGRPASHVTFGVKATLLAAGWLASRAQRLTGDGLGALDPETRRIVEDAVDDVLRAEALALDGGPDVDVATWTEVARGKTGALFMAAAEGGARRGDATDDLALAFRRYGMALGLAFQAADDLLDFEGSEATTGKPAGLDARAGAPNLARIVGSGEARRLAKLHAADAVDALARVPPSAAKVALCGLAEDAVARDR